MTKRRDAMTPAPSRPVDVYVRVSRVGGREGDSFISPSVQEERCRALATARGYEVGRVFTDLDQSGGTMDRPAFNEALARIRSGESGGIIVARIDRFSRTMQGALNTLQEIEEAGGFLVECDGDWDTSTPMGRFGRDLVLRIAQLFVEQIAESWDVTRRTAVERGVTCNAAPAGYRKREDGVLVPSEHAPAIRAAFEMRANGASQSDVARHLIGAGVPTAWSREETARWSIRAVQQLLRNRTYLGEARSGAYVKEGAHDPLVGRGVFHAVQELRGKARAASTSGGDGPLLGGGLLKCGSCGKSLTLDTTKVNGKRYGFYRCKTNAACTSRVCVSQRQAEPYLEGIVRRSLAGAVYEPERAGSAELDALRAALEDAKEDLRELVESDEPIPATVLAARGRVLEARAARAQEALDEAEASTVAPLTLPTSVEAWDALSVPERRRIMTALLGRVVVRRGRGTMAERIQRPDAPDDDADPTGVPAGLDDALAARVAERFASLYDAAHVEEGEVA